MRVYVYLAASGLSCAQTLQLGHVGLVAVWNVDLSPLTRGRPMSPALQGGVLTAGPPRESLPARFLTTVKTVVCLPLPKSVG